MKTKKPIPPLLATRILLRFLRDDFAEEVLGDLEQKFYSITKRRSLWMAKVDYWYQVINYFRPFALRKSKPTYHHFNASTMLRNNFKISWRNLGKQRMYSSIKIGGFALGITACFLIALYIKDELSYDKHITDAGRIFRVVGVFKDNGNVYRDVWFPAPMASVIRQEYPEVELTGRMNAGELFGAGHALVRREDQLENSYEDGVAFFDQSLLDMLQLPMIYGVREQALSRPGSVVITWSVAKRHFGDTDPTGKLLIFNNDIKNPYTVGGVIDDFPSTSHLKYNFLITMTGKEFWPGEQTTWGASNYPTYVRLAKGTDPVAFGVKMTKGVAEKYYLPAILASGEMTEKAAREMLSKGHLELQPVTDIYLDSSVSDGLPHGDVRFVWLFATVAGFILVIACINFINLSTARSANRAREVGVRKVVGSNRRGLINQFLTESLLFSFISFALAILLAQLLLPFFNSLSAKAITFPWNEWWLLPVFFGGALLIGFVAGLYPAFYLSSFRPIQVLKGNISRGSKSTGLRSSLVVFQFTASIILIISTLVIYRQMEFMLNKELGYDKDHVLLVQGATSLGNNVTTFKNELLQTPGVENVSVSDYLPVRHTKRNGNTFWREGRVKEDKGVMGQIWQVDNNYIETLGMKLLQGRDFDIRMRSDSQAVVINQKLVKKLGLVNPIGQRITNGGAVWNVIGVVQDFHFESLKSDIEPLVFQLGSSSDIVSVKIASTDIQSSIAAITTVWKKLVPHEPLRYAFLDERYARMYDDLGRTGKILTTFAVFAVAVACLGLFALSAYMVEQSSKEISIRLVLGASVNSVFGLLTKDFVRLVVIAFAIASPLAWYAMKLWLQDYIYKVPVGWDVFAITGLTSVLIAIMTVSYQSLRAALKNPVTSLRSE